MFSQVDFSKYQVMPLEQDNVIPVVFASDDNYFKLLTVLIVSILENSSKTDFYDFCIFDGGISEYNKNKLSCTLMGRTNYSIRYIDSMELINKLNFVKFNPRFTYVAYLRLFIFNIFSNYKKIIYLDCDVVVNIDLKEFYEIDIKDFVLAASHDFIDESLLKKTQSYYDKLGVNLKNYFNSGILLINIEKGLEYKVLDKAMKKLNEFNSPRFVEQDILNAVVKDCYFQLPPQYNIQAHLLANKIKQDASYLELLLGPKIIHYCGTKRPWSVNVILSEYFWKYAQLTPFYEEFIRLVIDNSLIIESLQNEIDIIKNDIQKITSCNSQFYKKKIELFGKVIFYVNKTKEKHRRTIFGLPYYYKHIGKCTTSVFTFGIPILKIKKKDKLVEVSILNIVSYSYWM